MGSAVEEYSQAENVQDTSRTLRGHGRGGNLDGTNKTRLWGKRNSALKIAGPNN